MTIAEILLLLVILLCAICALLVVVCIWFFIWKLVSERMGRIGT